MSDRRDKGYYRVDQYTARAWELGAESLTEAKAFGVLSDYADAHDMCPSCGCYISNSETERFKHAQNCSELLSDVIS